MTANIEESGVQFQTTDWTLLEVLQQGEQPKRDGAAKLLASRYWPPVYSWFRRKGFDREKARDLTQSFFMQAVVRRRLFEMADSNRGTLRSLMLTALQRFVVDDFRRTNARFSFDPLSDEALQIEDRQLEYSNTDADEAFSQQWTRALLEEALDIVEHQYSTSPRSRYWRAFEAWVIRPATSGNDRPCRESLAVELGFSNAAHLSVAVHAVKHRVRMVFEQIMAHQTVMDEAGRMGNIAP